ncbi:DUF2231 domain-containing protein [Nocardioides sp. AX2bis]|uniref:DUF2231 domain-containing protein n=1 Tax=Nocardioides sp. AX2bis TaxID=2653157 RepID=UPI0012F38267|nr:DUF2231 domain-containing protein [Nocardioides sp. AX2bis]VXC47097.1 conserved membrane hypothetical protein [Nocardioides sp. AX2bis]
MFDLINGLPVHPLVVHAVVVLLPLAILGTIALAVRPAWRISYGPLVVAVAAVATALVPVATSSGEALEKRVGDPGEHAALGDQLLWFALPVLVLSLVLVVLARRDRSRTADGTESTSSRTPARATTAVAVLAVLASLACAVQVYRVGDSGAKAVWSDQVSAAPSSTGD